MKSLKHTLLAVIISGGLTVGLLGMAYAAPAGSMSAEITITKNRAKEVTDTGGIGLEMGGMFKRVVGGSARQGDPDKSETVVQGVRHSGSLPLPKITIHDNEAEKVTNMGRRVTLQGVSVR